MSDRIVELQGRIDALESVARGLTLDQITSFPPAVRDAPKLAAWRPMSGTGIRGQPE
jgi:hypothetical protein